MKIYHVHSSNAIHFHVIDNRRQVLWRVRPMRTHRIYYFKCSCNWPYAEVHRSNRHKWYISSITAYLRLAIQHDKWSISKCIESIFSSNDDLITFNRTWVRPFTDLEKIFRDRDHAMIFELNTLEADRTLQQFVYKIKQNVTYIWPHKIKRKSKLSTQNPVFVYLCFIPEVPNVIFGTSKMCWIECVCNTLWNKKNYKIGLVYLKNKMHNNGMIWLHRRGKNEF